MIWFAFVALLQIVRCGARRFFLSSVADKVTRSPTENLERMRQRILKASGEEVTENCQPIVRVPKAEPRCLLVLFHGFATCPNTWEPYIADLVHQESCLTVVPLNPGHGRKHGGGPYNLPGGLQTAKIIDGNPEIRIPHTEHTEPEKYFDMLIDLAALLREAGLEKVPTKIVGGISLGAVLASAFALSSGLVWHRLLLASPTFVAPSSMVFWPAFFTTRINLDAPLTIEKLKNLGFLRRLVGQNRIDCDIWDKHMAPGYCRMIMSQIVTMFQFADTVMHGLTAIQESDPFGLNAATILEGMLQRFWGPPPKGQKYWRSWDGARKWSYPVGNSSRLLVKKLETIRSALRMGAAQFREISVEIITVEEDKSVHPFGTAKFLRLISRLKSQHTCELPKYIPHDWLNVYSSTRTFWWLSSTRARVSQFLLHGEAWPIMEGTRKACHVEAFTAENPPNQSVDGEFYSAEYYNVSLLAAADEVQPKTVRVNFTNPRSVVWRMRKRKMVNWKSTWKDVVVEALEHSQANSSGSVNTGKILVERKFVPSMPWDRVRLSKVSTAGYKVSGEACSRHAKKCKSAKWWLTIRAGPGIPADETNFACVLIPITMIMEDYDTDALAAFLSSGTGSAQALSVNSTPTCYCGFAKQIELLEELLCA